MIYGFRKRCDNGCHRQGGIMAGPLQLEYGYAAEAIRIGSELKLDRIAGALGLVVFFGPFQLAVALRWRAPVREA